MELLNSRFCHYQNRCWGKRHPKRILALVRSPSECIFHSIWDALHNPFRWLDSVICTPKKKIRFDALSIQRTPTIAADATNADADAKAELNTFSFIVHFWILLPKYCKVACLLLPHFLIYVSWKSHMTTFLALSLTHTHSPMTHLVLIWDGNCEKTRERVRAKEYLALAWHVDIVLRTK